MSRSAIGIATALSASLLAQAANAASTAPISFPDISSATSATTGMLSALSTLLPSSHFTPPPTPSGADPSYPLNHMADADVASVGTPLPNADFEEASYTTGTPSPNADLQTAPNDVLTVPNGDFGTGTFQDWEATGSNLTIQDGGAGHGSYAKFAGSGNTLVSSALSIPTNAQELVYDIYYISTSAYSGLKVYALTGANYETSTLLKDDKKVAVGAWGTSFISVVAYRGQSIKLKFVTSSAPAGLDNVKIQEVFPGLEITGSPTRKVEADGNAYAEINGSITTAPITIDTATQFLTFRSKATGSTGWELLIAEGPDFSTYTEVASAGSSSSWGLNYYKPSAYIGEQIKVRVRAWFGTTSIDDIGLMRVEVPQWSVSAGVRLLDDGAGNSYTRYNGNVTTGPVQIPAKANNLVVRARTDPNSGIYQNVPISVTVLYGTDYSQSSASDTIATTNDWATYRFGVGNFAGQTVKLKIASGSGTLNVDDALPFEQVLPGWTNASGDAIVAAEDANGSYIKAADGKGFLVRSSWIDVGSMSSFGRSYSIGFQVGTCQACIYKVHWTNEAGQSWQVKSAGTPQGVYRLERITVGTSVTGSHGYFTVQAVNGGRFYSLGDNVARQQLSEPFARKVGLGIDTSVGAEHLPETDFTLAGPIPITFTRYYNSHSDLVGPLGYRWSHTFDTHIEFQDADAAVVFGSGREEFFDEWLGAYTAVDPRVHSTLVKEADGTFTFTTKDQVVYRFDAAGLLLLIRDANGNELVMDRDAQSRLTSVTGAGGTAITLAYDAQGRLATVTEPTGAITTYGYSASGDLATVTDAVGGVRTYTYVRHLLDTVTDAAGRLVMDNDHDQFGRLTGQTDALGETITIAYETPGKGATQVTDPLGQTATFYFDEFQRTTHALDASGRTVGYLYDSNGNLDKLIDPAGGEWDFAFDVAGDLTATTDPLGNPSSFLYNPQHLPTTITDARGNTTTYTYDSDGNVTSVTDPLEHTTSFTYDAAGHLLTSTDALGRTTTHTYNAKGNRTSTTNNLNQTWTYTYDGAGRLTTETDPLGNTTSYVYDLLGRISVIRDSLLAETDFLWDPAGHLLRVTDPLGRETNWSYDAVGLVESKTDAGGKVWTYAYDENHRMTSVTDPLGHTTTYSYDEAGRLTSATDPAGHTTSYTYDDAGRMASKTTPPSRTTLYAYDDAGLLSQLTAPNGATIGYGRDPNGNVTTVTNELGQITTQAFDAANRLTSVSDPLANATTYGYNAADQLTSVADPLGHATTYAYDGAARLQSVTNAMSQATTYAYDAADRMVGITDATGRATTYAYDAAGRQTTITNNANQTTTNAYDAAGQLTAVTRPSGAQTTYAYNSRGLLTSSTDPLGNATTYSYDAARRMISETDPLNHTTSYGYDNADWLTSITDALSGVVTLGYNNAGDLTSMTDPRGQTWAYAYNALGLRTSVTDPLARSTTFAYDAAGRLSSRTDAREITTTYGYDAAGRQTSITYPGGSTSVAYDAASRRTSMTDATGTTTYGYNDADRVTSVAASAGTIGYTYDNAGRRLSMSLPGSRTANYTYDPAGRLQSLTDWNAQSVTFGYDADGNRTSIARPNDVDSAYVYDAAGQVTSISHTGPSGPLLDFDYTYDAAGNRTSVTSGAGTEGYGYDALNRLTSVSYPGGPNVSYSYDAAGNRTSETRGQSTTNYTYDQAGQLTTAGGTTYSHDANGNLTQAGSDTFTWDFDNRLTEASVGTNEATYAYDGDGVRVRSTVDADTDDLLVDRQGGLPTVVDDGESAYLHSGGLSLSVASGGTLYALNDSLGSVRGLSGASGALAGSASWEAFGLPSSQTGSSTRFGFTGEMADATGLTYLRARYLAPSVGRMLAVDTVSPNAFGTQGYNPYAYVANNPTTWTDPTGHLATGTTAVSASVRLGAQRFATFLTSKMVERELAGILAATVACEASIGQTGNGRVACVDAGGALIASTLFNIAAVGIGLAIWCATTPGCIGTAMALVDAITSQGSPGSENQLQRDPQDAIDTLPPTPQPGAGGAIPPTSPITGTTNCDAEQPGGLGKEVYRYTGPKEAKTAESTGRVPNVRPSGDIKNVFFTTALFTSAAAAEAALQIGAFDPIEPGPPPTHRITADPNGVHWCYAGNVESGTEIELTTQDQVRVIRVDPLGP